MPSAKVRQIADDLRSAIKAGIYPPGAQLPAQMLLVAAYEVSRTTVAKALYQLAEEGYLILHGRGVGAEVATPGEVGPVQHVIRVVVDQLVVRRRELGISQRELSARCGLSQPQIAELESGANSNPGLGTLMRYAHGVDGSLCVELIPG